ncbi:hypothetical protein GCM10010244_85560 [Streptomyces coeruleorubidus]|nr:hypothetical protein GCM10010244_85560 [Streptomyces bellus]
MSELRALSERAGVVDEGLHECGDSSWRAVGCAPDLQDRGGGLLAQQRNTCRAASEWADVHPGVPWYAARGVAGSDAAEVHAFISGRSGASGTQTTARCRSPVCRGPVPSPKLTES